MTENNGLERKIQTLHLSLFSRSKLEAGESVLKSLILNERHKERISALSNIALLLTTHQDQSDQKGKDSKEPASNQPAKKKQSSVDQVFVK